MVKMSALKLQYFDARGTAEVIRLMLAEKGEKYEDKRCTQETWKEQKAKMPLKALPVLEVGSEQICQSQAIARYIAREKGFYGKTSMDALHLDEISEAALEVRKELYTYLFEKDDTKKKDLTEKLLGELFPRHLDFFEKKLNEPKSKAGYFVTDKVTLADFQVFNFLDSVIISKICKSEDLFKARPKLEANYDKVRSSEKMAKYLKDRKESQF